MPEKRAVMLTAMLMRLSLSRSSSRIVGATFSVVCAKSQKVTTARTIPKMSLSVPRYSPGAAAAVVEVITQPSLRQIRQSRDHQGLRAGGQSRFDDRRKEFRVVDRDVLFHPTGLKGLLVLLRVDTADPPVSIGRPQSIGDVAEVLAGRHTSEVKDGL